LGNDLTERPKNVSEAPQDNRPTDAAQGAGIGWGLSAEDQEERFFLKRIAFSLVVAVVACAGAIMVLTTASSRSEPELALNARTESPVAARIYTVVLWTGAPAGVGVIQKIIAADEVKALAGRNEFRLMECQGGSKAMCVGRFEDPDSPQIKQLLGNFREVRTSKGAQPFKAATIQGYRE
jgi:hypothetical protein